MVNKVSILYKDASKKLKLREKNPEFIKDLQFDGILEIMTRESKNINSKRVIVSVLSELCEDPGDITYRYDILKDFLDKPQIFLSLQNVFVKLISLDRERQLSNRVRADVSAEYKLSNGISMLLGYCGVCKKLSDILKEHKNGYLSEGMAKLSAVVYDYIENDSYNKLEKTLSDLKKCVKGYMRLKLRATLDTSFKLKEAVVLDVDSNGFVSNILEKDEYLKERFKNGLKKLISFGSKDEDTYSIKQIDYILEENVNEIKDKTITNIANILDTMTTNVSSFLRNLSEEMLFYEGALKLVNTMNNYGLTTSKPVIEPSDERRMVVEGMYDLSFALYLSGKGYSRPMEKIVANDVCIKGAERIQIITGPNQGGKTTYIRAVGILQVLAQAGIPVPATKAVVSPVDQLLTHFPADERPESNEGRLGEELGRMLTILENATPKSLVLMNEAFASTNSREGSLIAQDILTAIAVIGAKSFFVTHLYELAQRVDNINRFIDGKAESYSHLVSMTALYEESSSNSEDEADDSIRKRTYRIVPGAPAKSSFAADIAAQYGIRYSDYVQKLM